jgi:hypothetical protein
MNAYEFGRRVGNTLCKQAAKSVFNSSGTYSGGVQTHDAQGNALQLNPAAQQRVNSINKIRAMNRGEAPVGPVTATQAPPSAAGPQVTRTKSRSAF